MQAEYSDIIDRMLMRRQDEERQKIVEELVARQPHSYKVYSSATARYFQDMAAKAVEQFDKDRGLEAVGTEVSEVTDVLWKLIDDDLASQMTYYDCDLCLQIKARIIASIFEEQDHTSPVEHAKAVIAQWLLNQFDKASDRDDPNPSDTLIVTYMSWLGMHNYALKLEAIIEDNPKFKKLGYWNFHNILYACTDFSAQVPEEDQEFYSDAFEIALRHCKHLSDHVGEKFDVQWTDRLPGLLLHPDPYVVGSVIANMNADHYQDNRVRETLFSRVTSRDLFEFIEFHPENRELCREISTRITDATLEDLKLYTDEFGADLRERMVHQAFSDYQEASVIYPQMSPSVLLADYIEDPLFTLQTLEEIGRETNASYAAANFAKDYMYIVETHYPHKLQAAGSAYK